MKYKVIFDTNSIRNAESVSDFLGGRIDLENFSKVADLIIPDLVIEEIKAQKRKHLISKRDSFLSNPFHFLRKLDENGTKDFDIEKWILELADKEKISYKLISLSEAGILEKIKKICLECQPPFEEGSDKGFKDAYIYFTILEFLDSCTDKNIFVVTKDERLKEAFLNITKVKVIRDYSEFEKYLDNYFSEDYFINRLKEEIDERINKDCIEDSWLNIDDNWVLKIKCEECSYLVEIDFTTKEIISSTDSNIDEIINTLILSGSFSSTHSAISDLSDKIKYLSDEDIQKLIKASVENEQIYWVSEDEDVKEFFKNIYQIKQEIIPEDIKVQFLQHFK
jgi:rRNA-processing protein FCF1